ncbi:hypothetical protein M0R45_013442 [Rubus argutus]|uniref:Uncharacterized protein n=1 Tax=Rubus argutus TaxID=59490 RepID=A0AAW1XIS3_RUBAR
MAEIDSGIGPDSEFEARETFLRDIRSPNEVGISPLSAFEERFKLSRFSRCVIKLGILPSSLLPEKSMWVRFKFKCLGTLPVRLALEIVTDLSFFKLPRITKGPLALTWTLETVRSVRFWRRASQTPVSRGRLLTAEKEWREATRSAGKRIGAMGQLRKWRDWRVERDLRAVKDKATSSEQLARVRE